MANELLIDDSNVSQYWNEYKTTPDEARREELRPLLRNQAQAEIARKNQEEDSRLETVYSDLNTLGGTFDASTSIGEWTDEDKAASANRQFVARSLGKTPADIQFTYPSFRDQVAKQLFNKDTVGETEMYSLVAKKFETKKLQRDELTKLQTQIVVDGLNDALSGTKTPVAKTFSDWRNNVPAEFADGLPDGASLEQAYNTANQMRGDMERLREPAAQVWKSLTNFSKGEASGADVLVTANKLASLPVKDRQMIYGYAAIAADASGVDRGAIEQIAKNIGSSAARSFDFLGKMEISAQEGSARNAIEFLRKPPEDIRSSYQILGDFGINQLAGSKDPRGLKALMGELSPEEREKFASEIEAVIPSFQVARELKSVAREQIDPLKFLAKEGTLLGAAERGLTSGLPGSLGFMAATAVNPILGMIALTEDEYDRIMVANPNADPRTARTIATVSGVIQGSLEKLQLDTMLGSLPATAGVLKNLKGLTRLGAGFGLNLVEQNAQEGIQDLVPILIDQLGAAVDSDIGKKDLKKDLSEWAQQRPEVFFAVLVPALIGGGVLGKNEAQNIDPRIFTEDMLKTLGLVTKEQREAILAAPDIESKIAALQAEYPKVTPAQKEEGARIMNSMMERQREQQQSPEFPTKEVVTNPDGSKTWVVKDSDGNEIIRTTDEQAADVAIVEQVQNKAETSLEAFNEFVKFFSAKGGETTSIDVTGLRKSAQDALDSGEATIEQLRDRMRMAGLESVPLKEASITGETTLKKLPDDLYKASIKLYEGANPLTVVEEYNHAQVKLALAEGRVTKEQLVGWLKDSEGALGESLYDGTDQGMIEGISRLGEAYFAGRAKDSDIPAPLLRFFKQIQEFFKEAFKRAINLRKAFDEGTLSKDFESFLAESVGISPEMQVDRVADKATSEVIGGTSFSIEKSESDSRAKPIDPNAPVRKVGDTTIIGPTSFSIEAYHGTPHKVDKFSLDKIGTGEGAQVYGWGLYFAQEKATAESYRTGLTERDFIRKVQEVYGEGDSPDEAVEALKEVDLSEGQRALLEVLQKEAWWGFDYPHQAVRAALREPENYDPSPEFEEAVAKFGNTYVVEIGVDENELMDLDKTINEQRLSLIIDKMRAEFEGQKVPKWFFNWLDPELTGDDFYNRLATDFLREPKSLPISKRFGFSKDGAVPERRDRKIVASRWLNSIGIPGAKYFDQGSRPGNKGTRNYVVFDDSIIKITHENGKAVSLDEIPDEGQPSYSITVYRAGDENESGIKPFSSWTKDKSVAQAYQDNPGYGGPVLREEKASPQNILHANTQNRSGMADFAQAIGFSEEDGADWFDSGWRYPWEESSKVQRALKESEFDAVEYIDDYPEFAKTIIFTKPIPEDGQTSYSITSRASIDAQEKRISEILKSPEERLRIGAEMKDKFNKLVRENADLIDKLRSKALSTATPDEALAQLEEDKLSALADIEIEREEAIQEERQKILDKYSQKKNETDAAYIARVNALLRERTKGVDEKFNERKRSAESDYRRQAREIKAASKTETAKEKAENAIAVRDAKTLNAIGQLEAILKILPPEIRGKIGGYKQLLQTSGEKAFAAFFLKRLDMIDKALEASLRNTYYESTSKILDRAQVKDNKSKLGPEAQSDIDYITSVYDMTEDELAVEIAKLEAEIGTVDDPSDAIRKQGLASMFGAFETRSSEQMSEAFKEIGRLVKEGKDKWKIQEEARRADNQKLIVEAKRELGLKEITTPADLTPQFQEAAQSDIDKGNARYKGIRRPLALLRDFIEGNLTWQQTLSEIFGSGSKTESKFEDSARKMTNNYVDAKVIDRVLFRKDIMEAFGLGAKETLSSLAKLHQRLRAISIEKPTDVIVMEGRKTKSERIPITAARAAIEGASTAFNFTIDERTEIENLLVDLPDDTRKKYITIDRVIREGKAVKQDMSELQAVHYLLQWAQPDIRQKMERQGFTEVSANGMRELLSDDAKKVMSWLQEAYRREHAEINPVFRRMNGFNLPKNENYAPAFFDNSKADGQLDQGPEGGSASISGMSSGFLQPRVNHSAPTIKVNALEAYWSHRTRVNYWIAFAEGVREMRAVLGNVDVLRAVEAKYGEAGRDTMKKRLKGFDQNGLKDEATLRSVSEVMRNMMGAQAATALGFKFGVLMKQFSATAATAIDIGPTEYVKGLGRLLSGQLSKSLPEIWKSDAIQRRILAGFTPEVRAFMDVQGLQPSGLLTLAEKGMQKIADVDAAFTTFGAAIAFDSYYQKAIADGTPPAIAERQALDAMDRTIRRTAQPADYTDKSLLEANGSVFGKVTFMFMSEARQKAAIAYIAAKEISRGENVAKNVGKLAVSWVVLNVMTQVAESFYKTAFSGDEPEDIWDWKQFALAATAGNLDGLYYVGPAISGFLSYTLDQKVFPKSNNMLQDAVLAFRRKQFNPENWEDAEDAIIGIRLWANALAITVAAFTGNQALAAAASLLNPVKDVAGAVKNIEEATQ